MENDPSGIVILRVRVIIAMNNEWEIMKSEKLRKRKKPSSILSTVPSIRSACCAVRPARFAGHRTNLAPDPGLNAERLAFPACDPVTPSKSSANFADGSAGVTGC